MLQGTRIYLIRHAESEGNIFRRAHGHYNGLVTDRGYKQIAQLEERLSSVVIDAVYASDLSRAYTTAEAISRPRKLEINATQMLREVNMGVWEDKAWGELEYLDSDMSSKFSHDPARWSVSGSEPYKDVQNRMLKTIKEIAERHDSETIAMVSHGFAIRALMCLLKNIPSHEAKKIPYCDNTAVTLLNYENDEIEIEYYSDNSHLNEENSTLAHQTWWRTEKKWASENLRFMPLNEVASESLIRIFKAKSGIRAHVDMQYAAYIADEPIGIIGLDTKRDEKRKVGWIIYIHVIPERRNKSYGTQLLGLAVSDFRKLGREKLRIVLPAGSLGINFMSRFGFSVLDSTFKSCLMEKDIKNCLP